MIYRFDSVQTVYRCDIGTIGDLERTPQGGLRIPAFPTRVGVFPYLMADGTVRREYRPADEVLSADSLATLAHAPVTDLHPEREGVRIPITPENYREYSVGHVAEDVRPMSDHVAATLLIQDQDEILKIESGIRRECSAGYGCIIDETAGVTDQGEIYDVIQRNIRYNHVAIGPQGWGRAGSSVALRLDSSDAVQRDDMKETIDGKEYTVGTAEWAEAKGRQLGKLTGERDAALGRADAAEKALKTAKEAGPDPKTTHAAITRRVRLIADCKAAAVAAHAKFDEEEAAGADEQSLMLDAIKLLDPAFSATGKSPDYLAGYFASLVKGLAGSAVEEPQDTAKPPTPPEPGALPVKTDSKSIFTVRKGNEEKPDHQDAEDPDKARRDMTERNRNAWKNPLGPNVKR